MKTKYLIKLFVLMLLVSIIHATKTLGQVLPKNDPAYYLAWADTFKSTNLDTTKWSKTFPWHQNSNYYSEFCNKSVHIPMAAIKAWRDTINWNLDTTNCKINNGSLKLYTRKENYQGIVWRWPNCASDTCQNNPRYTKYWNTAHDTCFTCWADFPLPFKFTTAMLFSKDTFHYGYFEIKFMLDSIPTNGKNLQGHGATFWLWGGGENTYDEIDCYEINAYDSATGVYYTGLGNSHYSANINVTPANSVPAPSVYSFSPNVWHTAGINWTSNAIDYYYDGIFQFESHNYPNVLKAMSIIITLGGSYVPEDNYCEAFDTIASGSNLGTKFPYTYQIGYVKVWQLKTNCTRDTTLSNFNASTYPNKLYNSITMNGVSLTNQTRQSFWGANYVLLNVGTSVDANSNVLFNTNNCSNISFKKTKSSSFYGPMPAAFQYKLSMHY
jgi:hypothetical protein